MCVRVCVRVCFGVCRLAPFISFLLTSAKAQVCLRLVDATGSHLLPAVSVGNIAVIRRYLGDAIRS